MRYSFSIKQLLPALLAFGACTLHEEDVEPTPPTGRVNEHSTVTYRRAGVPVLAHLYSDFGDFFAAFLAFGGISQPVGATYYSYEKSMRLYAVDEQNEAFRGAVQHGLALELTSFRGVGTYTPGTGLGRIEYQESVYGGKQWLPPRTYVGAPGAAQQLVVTRWDSVGRKLEGTFQLEVAEPGQQAVRLTEGRFLLDVE